MAVCEVIAVVKSIAGGNLHGIPTVNVGIELVRLARIAGVISLLAMMSAIKIIGPTPTAIMGSLEPLVAVGISVVIFHEPLTVNLLTGIVLIVSAVLLTVITGRTASRKKKA